ncbi:MAG: AMP-binding protein [Stenotrophomonas sp.]
MTSISTSHSGVFDPQSLSLKELTLGNVLRRQASAYPEKPFLHELAGGRTFTYSEMDAWSSRIAQGMHNIGIARGNHVGVLMENSAEHIALFFALGKIGAVSVPLNTAARGALLKYYLSHAECTSVVVDGALLERLLEALPELPLLKRIVVRGAPEGAAGEPSSSVDVYAFDALEPNHGRQLVDQNLECHELLMLAFTSGTTGPSKASMLSHAAALTYGTGAAEAQRYRASDVFYVCLPLFHNNALLASLCSALVCAGSVVLSARFSVSRFWQEIRESGATITNLLGAMTSFLWSAPQIPEDSTNRLRLVSMAPVPKYAREFEQRFGLRVMSNYGLSDFGMATSFTDRDPPEKLGSIGRARRGMQLKIVDEHDFEVPAGAPGELVIRCDAPWRATTGYYRMPEATLAANRNQWFHTGDRALCDADGFYWFVDRKKDCIRRRGENISAFEVEEILMAHPGVAQTAVFAVKTSTNDEEVAAVIVAKPNAKVTHAEIIEHCRRNMAYFMVPRYLQFRPLLPTTANLKIEKYRLQDDFQQDIAIAWDREAAGISVTR